MAVFKYYWRTPYTAGGSGGDKSGGSIDSTRQEWTQQSSGYSANIIDHIFTGDFEVVIAVNQNYTGCGMAYRTGGASLDHFTGYSSDANGPYCGGEATWGISDAENGNYNYLTQYHAFDGSGANQHNYVYHYKASRMMNELRNHYSTNGALGPWTAFSSANDTQSSVNHSTQVLIGVGTAGDNNRGYDGASSGYAPCTIVYGKDYTN